MKKSATFSQDRKYRYSLWRDWRDEDTSAKGFVMFVGLNPSTADETEDDPTIRRCITFARDWGYAGICMTNLFAFRATNPKDMLKQQDPIGADNDNVLCTISTKAKLVVAAWGTNGTHSGRDSIVKAMIPNLHYLKLTSEGYPGHPLYLPKTLVPIKWDK